MRASVCGTDCVCFGYEKSSTPRAELFEASFSKIDQALSSNLSRRKIRLSLVGASSKSNPLVMLTLAFVLLCVLDRNIYYYTR